MRENNKATVKFDSATQKAQERQWFINIMRSIRDNPQTHPKISIRDNNGEIPMLPKPPVTKSEAISPVIIPPGIKEVKDQKKQTPP